MIVVIDATLWISATHYGGVPAQAITQAALNADIAISNRIRNEVIKALTKEFRYSMQEAEEFDRRFVRGAIRVDITNSVRVFAAIPTTTMFWNVRNGPVPDSLLAGTKIC